LVDHMIKLAEEGWAYPKPSALEQSSDRRDGTSPLFHGDPETGVIVFYVEGFKKGEGRSFVLAASQCPKLSSS